MIRFIRNAGRRVRRFLMRKHGPLPVWGWIIAISAGVIVTRRVIASHQAGNPWPWQRGAGQQSNAQDQNQAYTSPQTPPDLMYEPGGGIPVDNSGAFPSSGGDMTGLLAILSKLIGQQRGGSKRRPKRKHNHGPSPDRGGSRRHKRPRSNAHVRHNGGGREKRNVTHGKTSHSQPRQGPTRSYSKLRQRPKVPVVGEQPRSTQRPEAAHSRPVREAPRPAPRPSAPAKRTMRTVRGKV